MNQDLWSQTTVDKFACASWNKENVEIETGVAETTFKEPTQT